MRKSKEHLFQTDIEYRTYRLRHFAQKHGWALANDSGNFFLFKNSEGAELSIDYSASNIETHLNHPKWGSTILIRKGDLTMKIIESIFRNPRAHMPEKIQSEYISQKS